MLTAEKNIQWVPFDSGQSIIFRFLVVPSGFWWNLQILSYVIDRILSGSTPFLSYLYWRGSSPLTCCFHLCFVCLPHLFQQTIHCFPFSKAPPLGTVMSSKNFFFWQTKKSKILNATVCLFSACRPTWLLVHGIQRSWTHPYPSTALARLVRKIDTYAVCRLWRVAPSGWVCKHQPCNDRGLASQIIRSPTIYWIQSRNDDGTT